MLPFILQSCFFTIYIAYLCFALRNFCKKISKLNRPTEVILDSALNPNHDQHRQEIDRVNKFDAQMFKIVGISCFIAVICCIVAGLDGVSVMIAMNTYDFFDPLLICGIMLPLTIAFNFAFAFIAKKNNLLILRRRRLSFKMYAKKYTLWGYKNTALAGLCLGLLTCTMLVCFLGTALMCF